MLITCLVFKYMILVYFDPGSVLVLRHVVWTVDIQVVAIASLTSTFYSCSLVTSLSCMTVAAMYFMSQTCLYEHE